MSKYMSASQESLLERAFDEMLQEISEEGNMSLEQAQEGLRYLVARAENASPRDLMPEE